jgi:hypothetical protein
MALPSIRKLSPLRVFLSIMLMTLISYGPHHVNMTHNRAIIVQCYAAVVLSNKLKWRASGYAPLPLFLTPRATCLVARVNSFPRRCAFTACLIASTSPIPLSNAPRQQRPSCCRRADILCARDFRAAEGSFT